jgi:transposase
MITSSEIQIKNLDHLGIVAGIIDEIGIVEIINDKLGMDSRSNIGNGQVVKAMLLNGLGIVSKPLYLFSQFFADKAIEKLLGPNIKSEYLNDDKLGRVMDKLYEYGLTRLFVEIVLVTINKFKIESKYAHLDATSFHLHGEYNYEKVNQENEDIIKERPIFITKGYSRDHRSDLKQCILDLVVSSDGDIPLFIRIADGNEADKAVFGKVFSAFKNQLNLDSILVADSALYSEENLKIMKDFNWITRVPSTISQAKNLIQVKEIEAEKYEDLEKLPQPEKDLIKGLQAKGYKWQEKTVNYGDIEQRWLIVESEKRKKSDCEKFEKQLQQSQQKAEKILKKFQNEKKVYYKLTCGMWVNHSGHSPLVVVLL